jgi:2-keto-4-pentenoate hydratase/2-oxohepta-3-ene-1,7-dioic acid hydratase in catechol pathway
LKIARFSTEERQAIGLIVDTGVVDLSRRVRDCPTEMKDLIYRWGQFEGFIRPLVNATVDYSFERVTLHAPVERPGKIMGIGLNYRDHAAEAHMELPKEQMWFSKAVTAIADPQGPIQLPRVSEQLDYEAELVVVIGKKCRHIPKERAHEVIFGYCIGNDVSVRDWQFKTSQFILGKSFDSHAPIGPWIVTADAIDPHTLEIRSFVNGEERQHSNTRHFIFDCYDMVETLSKVMTLEPGDILFTGTPAGVGAVRKPPLWLRAGDRVRVEIDGIGAIENSVVPE